MSIAALIIGANDVGPTNKGWKVIIIKYMHLPPSLPPPLFFIGSEPC